MLFEKLLKISDNGQENLSAGTSFLIKVTAVFIKKDTPVKGFSCECWKTFNTCFIVFLDE